LAIKFNGGVMMAADTLGSYGSLARFRDERRLKEVGDATIIGGSGDLADYHHILHMLEDLEIENGEWDDGQTILPKSVHSYMTRVLYNRRTKMNPLWNTVVVGGFANGEGYLGYCDKIGVAYNDDVIATGYGSYIALPIMRRAYEENQAMTEAEARALLERCLKVMYYRDARSLNRFQIATSTAAGVVISEPEAQETNWDIATMVKGYE
jgi:20S proteasome subunit beta 7